MENVSVGKSEIHGVGVFAERDFDEGEIILEIDDSRLVDDSHSLRPELGEYDFHCDYLENGKVVLMRSPERHINSCCEPNTFVKTIEGKRYVVARREIKKGEELTYDYIIDCHGGIVWECNCKHPNCRKIVPSSFFDLPTEKQLEYLSLLNHWFVEEHRERIEKLRDLQNK